MLYEVETYNKKVLVEATTHKDAVYNFLGRRIKLKLAKDIIHLKVTPVNKDGFPDVHKRSIWYEIINKRK